MLFSAFGFSQSINFDQLGKEKWLRYNGGIAANGVYYNGDANRQAFTYFLTENLKFNIAGLYNIPLSFTYSNQEFDFLIAKKDRAEIIFTTNPIHQDLFKGWKNGGYYRNPSTRLFEPSGFAKKSNTYGIEE